MSAAGDDKCHATKRSVCKWVALRFMLGKLKRDGDLNPGDRHSRNAVTGRLPDVLEVRSDGQESAVEPAVVHFHYLLGAGPRDRITDLSINPPCRNNVILTRGDQPLITCTSAPKQGIGLMSGFEL